MPPETTAGGEYPYPGRMEAEVVQVFPSVIVVKHERGQTMVLQLTPRTQVSGILKPGDRIVVYTTPYGVSSVQLKTASTALLP